MINDEYLEEKWDELTDVPFDEVDGRLILATDWWVWSKGTDREAIWSYFDSYHSKGVHWLLYER